MCLACPMRVQRIDGFSACCEARGEERQVGLLLLQGEDLAVGDWVLVHLGQALHRLQADEAAQTWALLDEMLASMTPRQHTS